MFWDEFDDGGSEKGYDPATLVANMLSQALSDENDARAKALFGKDLKFRKSFPRDGEVYWANLLLTNAIGKAYDLGVLQNYGGAELLKQITPTFYKNRETPILDVLKITTVKVEEMIAVAEAALAVEAAKAAEVAAHQAASEKLVADATVVANLQLAKAEEEKADAAKADVFQQLDLLQPQSAGQAKRAGFTGAQYREWLEK